MNKLKSEEILDRTTAFIEQLIIDKMVVTDEHEFLVLTTYYRNTDFYQANKDKIDLSQYKNMKDVVTDMLFKISKTPFLCDFILAGLFPVMYDKYYEVKK